VLRERVSTQCDVRQFHIRLLCTHAVTAIASASRTDAEADAEADAATNYTNAAADTQRDSKPDARAHASDACASNADASTSDACASNAGTDAEPHTKPHAGADARLAAGRVRACRVGSVHLWCSRTVCPRVPELLHQPVQLFSTRAVQRQKQKFADAAAADTQRDGAHESTSPTSGNVQRQQHRYLLRWGGLFQRLCLQ
jgi:hypothetical protein